MDKILHIALREYIESVKSKAFIFSILFTPILIIGIVFISSHTEKAVSGPREARTIVVINRAPEIVEGLREAFADYNKYNEGRQIVPEFEEPAAENPEGQVDRLKEAVGNGEYDGLLVIPEGIVESESQVESQYFTKSRNVTEIDVFQTISHLVNQTIVNERFRRHDLSPELISRLRRHVPVQRIDVAMEQASPAESVVTILAPFFFLFLMFAGVFGTNQQMLTSVIEEKNSRVMEILLAAVSPFQLMAGKILGLTAVGFTLIFFWGGGAIAAAALRGMGGLIHPGLVVYFVIYFVLGFLVISSILAAIGSVCNTVKEAQSLMAPVTMVIVAPMVAWIFIASNPNGTLAIVLSFIPPITPMIMILRLAVEPDLPIWQIAATILLLAASVPAVMWASAKVFRTGILMYGKPPSIRELVRWVRYK